MKYFLGLLGVFLGIILIIKTEWLIQNFGTNEWAEQHMGTSGGSRLLYKIIGLIIIFVAMLSITGLMNNFLEATIGKIFGI